MGLVVTYKISHLPQLDLRNSDIMWCKIHRQQVISDWTRSYKMDKVTFQIVNDVEYAIIDRGNNEFTSMTKEYYDAQQANSGSSVPNDPTSNL